MKKRMGVSVMLVMTIVVTLILTQKDVFAALKYIRFEQGKIKIQFQDKAASSDVIYKTVGWIIHKNPIPTMDAYRKERFGQMVGDGVIEVGKETLPDGSVITDFEIAENRVLLALTQADLLNVEEGGTVYLDSVFEVRNKATGQRIGDKYYYSYNAIVNAAPWGEKTKEDLKAYYNIPIQFQGSKYAAYKEIFINGKLYSREELGMYKAGEDISVEFPMEIEVDGKKCVLKKTYFEENQKRGKPIDVVTY